MDMNSEKMVQQWDKKFSQDLGSDLKVAAMWQRTDFIIELGEPMDTWRFRLANFISGGAWARDRKRALEIIEQDRDVKAELRVNLNKAVQSEHHQYKEKKLWRDTARERGTKCEHALNALSTIANMETPKCAHIGKRMAEAARKGLEA